MHTGLHALWMPILLSAVLVFVVSSLLHMVTKWHAGDFRALPDEPAARKTIGALNIPPGDYVIPRPMDMNEMKSTDFAAKMNEGPVVIMTVAPNGMTNMGQTLGIWFAYSVVVSILAGYVAAHAIPVGGSYLAVFRIVGTVAFCGYSLGLAQYSIWYHKSWSTTIRSMLDGLLYALLTAGAFGWRWPAA